MNPVASLASFARTASARASCSGLVRFVDEAERQACDQPNLVAAVRKAVGGRGACGSQLRPFPVVQSAFERHPDG